MKWDSVCKNKKLDDFGIKSIEEFNLTLLTKWKWKILREEKSLWKRVLKARYGGVEHQLLMEQRCNLKRSSSNWWEDLCIIGELTTNKGFCFADSIK